MGEKEQKVVIDEKDMARRKVRLLEQRWDIATRIGKIPTLGQHKAASGKGTYGVTGVSIFSPFTPTKNLPVSLLLKFNG